MTSRVVETLEYLEFDLAAGFVHSVSRTLRRLNDLEINTLYLETHTGPNMGEAVHPWIAVLMPLIGAEVDLRRDIAVVPDIGPVVSPELYRVGGGHHAPF